MRRALQRGGKASGTGWGVASASDVRPLRAARQADRGGHRVPRLLAEHGRPVVRSLLPSPRRIELRDAGAAQQLDRRVEPQDHPVAGRVTRGRLWQGWWDHELDATIDLGRVRPIGSVSLSFLENEGAWIVPPDSVEIFVSRDGEAWTGVEGDGIGTTNMADSTEARFLRFRVTRGILPVGHPGAGQPGWVFADEIVVR